MEAPDHLCSQLSLMMVCSTNENVLAMENGHRVRGEVWGREAINVEEGKIVG